MRPLDLGEPEAPPPLLDGCVRARVERSSGWVKFAWLTARNANLMGETLIEWLNPGDLDSVMSTTFR